MTLLLVIFVLSFSLSAQVPEKVHLNKVIDKLEHQPYDYSFACGHPGETTHPDVVKAQTAVKKACDKAGVPLIGFANQDNIMKMVSNDYRMFLVGHDVRPDGRLR